MRAGVRERWGEAIMDVKKVLVVADQEKERDELCRIVNDVGCRALVAESGSRVLDMINEEKPDLILLDVVADEMDGFKTCRELTLNPDIRDIPVVVISAQQQRVDELWAEQQGADGVLYKPFSSDDLLRQIRRLT